MNASDTQTYEQYSIFYVCSGHCVLFAFLVCLDIIGKNDFTCKKARGMREKKRGETFSVSATFVRD